MQTNKDINLNFSTIDFIESIEEVEQIKYHRLIENYENLVKSNIKNLYNLLNNEKNKPIIIYNLGLLLELFLKMILLKMRIPEGKEIWKYNHKIAEMFKVIIEKTNDSQLKTICQKIKERASSIKQSNGNKVDYNCYPDFRYNHKKENFDLIFTNKINEEDIKHIKEVIECIELVMR